MSDQETISELSEKAKEVEKMGDTIVRAAEGRRPMPIALGDSLKNLAELTSLCEDALGEHIDGSLGKEALNSVVTALNAIHSGIDSLTVFQALDGAAYNTITVAND
jgi:hypothetical protein